MRVETTCPSFTNVGPSRNSPSRMNSAAAVFAADTSAASPFVLPAFSTLRALLAAKPHTSSVRLSAEPWLRLCQPSSMLSPPAASADASSSSVAEPRENRSVFAMSVRNCSPAVRHSSGSSMTHSSATSSSTACCSSFFIPINALALRHAPITASRLRLRGGSPDTTAGAISAATWLAALTLSNSSCAATGERGEYGWKSTALNVRAIEGRPPCAMQAEERYGYGRPSWTCIAHTSSDTDEVPAESIAILGTERLAASRPGVTPTKAASTATPHTRATFQLATIESESLDSRQLAARLSRLMDGLRELESAGRSKFVPYMYSCSAYYCRRRRSTPLRSARRFAMRLSSRRVGTSREKDTLGALMRRPRSGRLWGRRRLRRATRT